MLLRVGWFFIRALVHFKSVTVYRRIHFSKTVWVQRMEHTKCNVEAESEGDRSTEECCDGAMARRRSDDGTVTVKWEKPTWRLETINHIPVRLALFQFRRFRLLLNYVVRWASQVIRGDAVRWPNENGRKRAKDENDICYIGHFIFDAAWSTVSVCVRAICMCSDL